MIFEDVHWIHPTSLEVVGRTGEGRASSSVDRTALCPHHPRIRKVRWIASGVPSAPRVTSATIAGQKPPEGCFRPV
jgi:hypothetical protein